MALVREATRAGERALEAPRVPADPMRAALGLCTTPADFTALLRHVREDANLTLREITDRSARLTSPISKTSAADMLSGERLPSTEQLHAFLLACKVPPERTLMWHHAVTRLKIAQIRQLDAPLRVSPRLFLADHQPWMTSGIALLAVLIQILQIFGRWAARSRQILWCMSRGGGLWGGRCSMTDQSSAGMPMACFLPTESMLTNQSQNQPLLALRTTLGQTPGVYAYGQCSTARFTAIGSKLSRQGKIAPRGCPMQEGDGRKAPPG